MRNDLVMLSNAVNGMLTTCDDNEKSAWVTIYNARYTALHSQIDEEEKAEQTRICECAPAEPETAPAEEDVPKEAVDAEIVE